MNKELDQLDKKILYELDINSRASASKIARNIKIPKETVNYRIRRLINDSWVERLYTIFNASRFGYSYYKIFLKFHKLTAENENKIIEYITENPTCINLRIFEGKYDLAFLAIQNSVNELRVFLQQFFNNFGTYVLEKEIHTLTTTYKLNQKFLHQGKTVKKIFSQVNNGNYLLDEIDLGIIKLISTNARVKLTNIANDLHIDSRLIKYRIKKLEKEGVIVTYATALNLAQINREFIQMDIVLNDPSIIPPIIDFFDKTNTCIFAYELLGKYDLSIEIYVKNDEMLKNILKKFKMQFLDDYVYYDVSHIYKEYVINWSPFHV